MDWNEIDQVVKATRANVLLYGPPGTGKTTYANRHLGVALPDEQRPFSLTVSDDSTVSDVLGMYIPGNQAFVWHDGPGIRAWRYGIGLIINEIDQAAGPVKVALHAILDDPEVARLTLPTGETVQPALGFRVIATSNGTPDDLEPALLDRFTIRLEAGLPCAEALAPFAPAERTFIQNGYSDPENLVTFREYRIFRELAGKL